MINNQPDVDKIYLCAKGLYEPKHQLLIDKQQDVGLNILRTRRPSLNTWMLWKMSIRVLSTTQKKRKVLIVFDHMIADVTSNKKIHPVVTDLFIRGWKINFLLCSFLENKRYKLLWHDDFKKLEVQQIAFGHSSDIRSKDFM